MPSWNDDRRWAELIRGTDCPLCTRASRGGVAAELASCLVTVDPEVHVRGYCCLVLRRHAVELHQLTAAEGAAFMGDVQHASRVLQELTGAVKINYEIHGNIIPHVHMHLVPRYRGDAIERTGRGFAAQTEPVYAPGEFEAFAEELSRRLAAR